MSVAAISTAGSAPIAFDFQGRSSAGEYYRPPVESLLSPAPALPHVASGRSYYVTSPSGTHLDNAPSNGQTHSYSSVTEQSVDLNRPILKSPEEDVSYPPEVLEDSRGDN